MTNRMNRMGGIGRAARRAGRVAVFGGMAWLGAAGCARPDAGDAGRAGADTRVVELEREVEDLRRAITEASDALARSPRDVAGATTTNATLLTPSSQST